MHLPGRRDVLLLLCGAAAASQAAIWLPAKARAQMEIDVNQGQVNPMPIAVPAFLGASPEEAQFGADIAGVIANNLDRSGLFRPLPQESYLQRITNFAEAPSFPDWRAIKADALVTGQVSMQPDGRLKAEFRLWDVIAQNQVLGLQFVTTPKNWRRIGHLISDAIYKALTGEDGYFDTRIVFVEETGPKDKRVKRLAIMDQDGFNMRRLTDGKDLVLTPRFNPASQEITYVSYAGNKPRVYLYNIETQQKEIVGVFSDNSSIAPRFSPDGQQMVLSILQGATSNIFILDLRSKQLRQLTNTAAIDTAPSFSPDGSQIVFESDRGGTQQLYVMGADGSNQQRISFGEGRYSTPVWSPRGDLIAYTAMRGGQFGIGVMKPDGSGERILTEGFHNEGPTWAPNGRVIMFFRETPGEQGGPKLFSVDVTGYNERAVKTTGFASDPAWSPLLK
jgi:TolB protein